MKVKAFVVILAALLISIFHADAACADGLIVIDRPYQPVSIAPRRWPAPHYVFAPLQVQYHHVKVTITDQVAVTEVDQSFYNSNNQRLEGTYIFPIPKGAQIDNFKMDINGEFMEAELLDADKARGIYEDIVRRMKDPALLEYAGQGLFKVRIYPIEPLSEKKIKLKYTEVLNADAGMLQYRYPLNTEKFSSQPLKSVSVKVSLKNQHDLKTVYSPSHSVEVKRSGARQATVGWEASNVKPDTDFQLFFAPDSKSDIGMNVLTYHDNTDPDGGHFLLTLTPALDLSDQAAIKKDVIFVFDTSGSMAEKDKIGQARKALHFCLSNLNQGDRFEIVRFSTEAEALFEALHTVGEESLKSGRDFVSALKPRGGTAIEEALLKAVATVKGRTDRSRPAFVVFLTDGQPTIGNVNEAQIVERVLREIGSQSLRVFPFGVGTDVDTHLLDKIAEGTRAATQYVLPDEDIEVKVSNFYEKIDAPVLTDLRLKLSGGVKASKLYPQQIPDLFKGQQLVVMGRYTGNGHAAVILEGEANGKRHSFTYEAKFPSKVLEHGFIPKLWATRRVGFLLDQIRLHGENGELQGEVTRLAKRYGIVTPYTAYLIVEDEARRSVPIARQAFRSLSGDKDARAGAGRVFNEAQKKKSGWAAVDGAEAFGALREAEVMEAPSIATDLALRSAPASGLEGSGLRKTLQQQESRYVEGRTFYRNGNRWIDGGIDSDAGLKRVKIKFGSDQYFALLAKDSRIAKWLSLGSNMEFLFDGSVYEITD